MAASLLVFAYFARQRKNHWLTGLSCALALGIKVTVFPALTFLLWPFRKGNIMAFTLTVLLMYAPFLLQGSRADLDGLLVFTREWEFNASLYSIGASLFPQNSVKLLMLGLFTTGFLVLWFSWQRRGANQKEIPATIVAVYGILFLVSPVVNSWYLVMVLPFVCLAPRPWSVGALIVVSLSYVRGQTLPFSPMEDFQQPLWIQVTEYAIVLTLLALPLVHRKYHTKNNQSL